MDINIEKRGSKKVKRTMPNESAHDAGLSIQEEIRRSMYECIDRFIQELSTRYEAIKQINNIFQIIETKFMLEASDDALAVIVHNLIQIYGEFDKEQVSQKVVESRSRCVRVEGGPGLPGDRVRAEERRERTMSSFISEGDGSSRPRPRAAARRRRVQRAPAAAAKYKRIPALVTERPSRPAYALPRSPLRRRVADYEPDSIETQSIKNPLHLRRAAVVGHG
ncbi:hypothetical protein EVAR_44484_1 [Eumeta japonica]|uniref:Uncharacterized protein n=1 Tax=Eumeta variegata TaxID=151549 RepID=A0A4C1WMH7_EUMVA|nr:hypothetical protein EVAR_44484_1 [Eumeta japonica]